MKVPDSGFTIDDVAEMIARDVGPMRAAHVWCWELLFGENTVALSVEEIEERIEKQRSEETDLTPPEPMC